MPYQIITDATADLTPELTAGLPRVEIIPMEVTVDGKTYHFGADGDISPRQFYALLKEGRFATTSQINPETYTQCFEKHLRRGIDVLYLGFSSGLSSTLLSAEMSIIELREKYPERKILCIDTLAAAPGEGLLVRTALEKQASGMEMDELSQWILNNRLRLCHWVTVDTFTHLHHGGRVSGSSAAMGTLLQIKPILHMNQEGKLEAREKPRGRKAAAKLLLSKLESGWDPTVSDMIFVGHGDNREAAELLSEQISQIFPNADVRICDIGPIIGAHTGPGVLTVFYWGSNR